MNPRRLPRASHNFQTVTLLCAVLCVSSRISAESIRHSEVTPEGDNSVQQHLPTLQSQLDDPGSGYVPDGKEKDIDNLKMYFKI